MATTRHLIDWSQYDELQRLLDQIDPYRQPAAETRDLSRAVKQAVHELVGEAIGNSRPKTTNCSSELVTEFQIKRGAPIAECSPPAVQSGTTSATV